jgi:outer membrane receptor protein involved in Fe transport
MSAKVLRLFTGTVAALCMGPGHAQGDLEEILVVAQKREEPLQQVPRSVSVLSGERIESAGIEDVFDVAEEVSALTVVQNTGPLHTSFRLRRIGSEPNIPDFEPSVGLFVDGAFRSRTGVAAGDLFDIERIEILKGPQTVLYGKNTTAGIVSIITRAPTDIFEMSGRASVGRIDGYDSASMLRVGAAISAPLTDRLSGRLSGSFFDHGHTMKNLFVPDNSQDMNRYSLRGQLLYKPSDRLDARVIFGRFVIDSANASEFEIDEGVALGATNASFGVPCPRNSATDRAFCNNRAVVADLDANDVTVLVDFDSAIFSLTSITGYEEYDMARDFDADQLNIDVVNMVDRQSSRSYSQELRIASVQRGKVDWLGGVYFHRNEFLRGDPARPAIVLGSEAPFLQLPGGIPLGQPGDAGIATSRTESDHYSIFGSLTWQASQRLALSAGTRWQQEDKSSAIVNIANHSTPTLISLVLAPPGASTNLSRSSDAFSWNLTAKYQWTGNVMGYASATKGFKPGGFNAGFSPTPGASREFDDESVVSYEIGVKSLLAEQRVRLNASGFYAEYDDYQSAGFVSLRFRVNNAEKVRVSGVEVDVEALVGERLTASASISYADARYGVYTGGACHYGRLPDNADSTACVLSGSALHLAPKLKTRINVDYSRPVAAGTLYFGAGWTWVDRHNTDAALDPRHWQGSYGLLNIKAGIRLGKFDISGWVNNADDETIILQSAPTNLFSHDPAYAQFLGAPRSYGTTLRVNW